LPDPRDVSVYKLLSKIACELVDQPEFITIKMRADEYGARFTIQAHPDDTGKIIGRQGRNSKSLRIILSAIGKKLDRHYAIEVDGEPGESDR
jgi:uncharacterized protein